MLLSFLYILLPGFQVYLYLHEALSFGFGIPLADAMNLVLAILALQWMLANVAMGAKVPMLQKHLPYDKRIQYHIYSSLGIALAVTYHGLYKIINGYFLDIVSILLLVVVPVMLMAAVMWGPVPGFRKFRERLTAASTRLVSPGYDSYKIFHQLAVLGLSFLLMFHIFRSGMFAQTPVLSKALYIASFTLSTGLYLFSLTRAGVTKAIVTKVVEHEGIVTLSLSPLKPLNYRSGQFAFLRFGNDGKRWVEHPFSFLTGGVDASAEAKFSARKLGNFTTALSRVNPGDILGIRGSFGAFYPRNEERIVLIGSGIGIVPLMSIIEELAGRDAGAPVPETTAVLSVRNRREIPEIEAFLERVGTLPNLKLHLLVYEEDGRLFSREFFQDVLPDARDARVYLCSSPTVRNITIPLLKQHGFSSKAIQYEAFSF